MLDLSTETSISQVLEILKHMDKKLVNKIPNEFMNLLEEKQNKNYISDMNHKKRLDEMNLNPMTQNILSLIYIKYWCNKDERNEYKEILKKNQQKLYEKYDYQNLFKNKKHNKQ